MGEDLFLEIVRYVGFGPGDEAALRALHPGARPHFAEIADTFYDRILEHPQAAAVLRSPEQVDRLKVSLRAWLDRLLAGPWDREYFELRTRIGRRHVLVKLPQRYMFTAMSVIRLQLLAIARDEYAEDAEGLRRATEAVCRVLDLELAIMLESYREDSLAVAQRLERIERDLLEHRLELTEQRYDVVVENAEVLVIVLDLDQQVLLFNRKAEEVTDYRRGEMIGRRGMAVVSHPEDRELASVTIEAALRGDRPPPFVGRVITHGGEERSIRWHVTALPAPGGPQACAIGVDVTEERALLRRTQRVERLAALGTLSAGLAHEIRNPLNAAQLQLQVLERRVAKGGAELGGQARQALDLARHELQRLSVLVLDFLAFARPGELQVESSDLAVTLAEVVGAHAPRAEEAGVALRLEAEGPLVARYDRARIQRALGNLLENAIEAAASAPAGSREVTVAPRRQGDDVVVEVADSGPGVSGGVDVFEPFLTTKEQGTGLGLPIVSRIASDHGGDVSFSREEGRTVFRLELPVDGPPREVV